MTYEEKLADLKDQRKEKSRATEQLGRILEKMQDETNLEAVQELAQGAFIIFEKHLKKKRRGPQRRNDTLNELVEFLYTFCVRAGVGCTFTSASISRAFFVEHRCSGDEKAGFAALAKCANYKKLFTDALYILRTHGNRDGLIVITEFIKDGTLYKKENGLRIVEVVSIGQNP